MADFPEQTYYPSWKVNLSVRLEEYNDKDVPRNAPAKPSTLRKGTGDKGSPLKLEQITDPDTGAKRWRLTPVSGKASGGNPQRASASTDGFSHDIVGVVPKEVQLGMNGARQADTLNITIRYIDLPIDPRCVRACAVEFFLGTVSADEFERGCAGMTRSFVFRDKMLVEPMHVVPDTYTDASGKRRSNLRFQGWVDKWEISVDGDSEPTVKLECRDNTTLLIDHPQPHKGTLAINKPIDEAIAQYLTMFPQMEGMAVEYRPTGIPVPVLKAVLSKSSYQEKLGPPAKAGGSGKTSVLDYLVDMCRTIGHNLRIEGSLIVIQPVQTLYSNKFSGRPDDAFQGRTLPDGQHIDTRHFIYGRNVSEFRLERAYGKAAPTNIEVRCYNDKAKTTLIARFPEKNDQVIHANPGDRTDQKWRVEIVQGVTDQKSLRFIARAYYETLGRNELSVTLKTKNLASFGGGNEDPDILDMKAGDAITLLMNSDDGDDKFSGITDLESLLLVPSKAQEYLTGLGYSDEFAAGYVKAYTDSGFQTVFKLKQLGITCNANDGVSLDVQAINYIEVRADKALPTGEEIDAKGKTAKNQQAAAVRGSEPKATKQAKPNPAPAAENAGAVANPPAPAAPATAPATSYWADATKGTTPK